MSRVLGWVWLAGLVWLVGWLAIDITGLTWVCAPPASSTSHAIAPDSRYCWDAINEHDALATKSDEAFGIRRFRSIGGVPTEGLRPLWPLSAVSVRSSGWPYLPI